jgi:glutaminyl-tRNA synthetase
VRLYDRLFSVEDPDAASARSGKDFTAFLNPESLEALTGCKLEPQLGDAAPGTRYQFERLGYFAADPDTAPGAPVFNRTVSLKDSWGKIAERAKSTHTAP